MFELLVPATKAQMDRVQGDKQTYDRRVRPELMLQTIRALHEAGVEPDIWKIEGLDDRKDCERVVEMARRDGRSEVGCIVLGRGADETKVVGWLETAASSTGFHRVRGRTHDLLERRGRLRGPQDDATGGCRHVWRGATASGRQYSKRARPSVQADEICVALHPDDQRRLSAGRQRWRRLLVRLVPQH